MTRRAISIINGSGLSGIVSFSQENASAPVHVLIDIRGFRSGGIHAIHIHEYGDMRSGCKSLGGHWNPSGTDHGHAGWTTTRHAGDLINNIHANPQGVVMHEFSDPSLTLYGNDSILGRSVVIHEGADDLGLLGIPARYSGKKKPHVSLYADMNEDELRRIILGKNLAPVIQGDRSSMIRFLEKKLAGYGKCRRSHGMWHHRPL